MPLKKSHGHRFPSFEEQNLHQGFWELLSAESLRQDFLEFVGSESGDPEEFDFRQLPILPVNRLRGYPDFILGEKGESLILLRQASSFGPCPDAYQEDVAEEIAKFVDGVREKEIGEKEKIICFFTLGDYADQYIEKVAKTEIFSENGVKIAYDIGGIRYVSVDMKQLLERFRRNDEVTKRQLALIDEMSATLDVKTRRLDFTKSEVLAAGEASHKIFQEFRRGDGSPLFSLIKEESAPTGCRGEYRAELLGNFSWGAMPLYYGETEWEDGITSPFFLEIKILNAKAGKLQKEGITGELRARYSTPLFRRDDACTFQFLTGMGFRYFSRSEGDYYVLPFSLSGGENQDPQKIAGHARGIITALLQEITGTSS
ncbi:MAG: hypothetical protein IJG60_06985 [Thermoguttaceae bacterium]|nr:hypothetical protein [Thermoguttaceae bacterium]